MGDVLCICGPLNGKRIKKDAFNGAAYESTPDARKIETIYDLLKFKGENQIFEIFAPREVGPDLVMSTLIAGYERLPA